MGVLFFDLEAALVLLMLNTTTNTLTLFCLVDGEATSKAFPVDIESRKTIGDLKKLIKAE